jgi:hypothetical protein
MTINLNQRPQNLGDNIKQPETLLKSFKDTLSLEDDPRRKIRCEEIQQIKASIAQYRQEYRQLEETQPVASSPVACDPAANLRLTTSHAQRSSLSQFLGALPGPQLEQVVFILNPPLGHMPPNTVPQSSRAVALLQWAEGQSG